METEFILLIIKRTNRLIAFILYVACRNPLFLVNLQHYIVVLFESIDIGLAISRDVIQCVLDEPEEPGQEAKIHEEGLVQLQVQENEKE